MFDFLRDAAEKIYIVPGLNKKGKGITKIGYTSNIKQRAASYRAHGFDTDLSNNRGGDKVDETLMKTYCIQSGKIQVDSYSRTKSDISEWNPWVNTQDPWFGLSEKELAGIFNKIPLNEVYSNVKLGEIYWDDLFMLPPRVENTIDHYIDYSILSKKSVSYWRVMFTKCNKDVDTFYKIIDDDLVRCFEDFFDNENDLLEFKKLYIQFLTTYNNDLRNKVRDKLFDLIGGH